MRQAKMILIFGFIFLIGIASLFGQINISSEELSLKPALAERQNTIIDFSLRVPEQIASENSKADLIAEKPGNRAGETITSTGTFWGTASHWDKGRVPTTVDTVIINSRMQTGNVPRVCNSLIVNSSKNLSITANSSLTVGAGDITIYGILGLGNADSDNVTSLSIQGNLTISTGILIANAAKTQVYFNGTTAQTFTNNGNIFGSLLYNMTLWQKL